MHISYMPQCLKYAHSPICMPCWMTNPLHILEKENRVLIINTPKDLPEDIGAAIINEIAVFGRMKTVLYSLTEDSVAVIKKLMEQLGEVEDLLKTDLRFSKDCKRMTDAVKALEKAPLFIYDKELAASELVNNAKQLLENVDNPRTRYKFIIIDDLTAIKDIRLNQGVDKTVVEVFVKELATLAKQSGISIILMSHTPLNEMFPIKSLRPVYVTIGEKEFILLTLLSE